MSALGDSKVGHAAAHGPECLHENWASNHSDRLDITPDVSRSSPIEHTVSSSRFQGCMLEMTRVL